MDDEVRITDIEDDIRMMAAIQNDFAEWAGMKFRIHKCLYWGRKFVKDRGGRRNTWKIQPMRWGDPTTTVVGGV